MTFIAFLAVAALVFGVVTLLTKRVLQGHDDRARAAWERVQSCLEQRHALAGRIFADSARPDSPTMQSLQDILKQAEFVSGLAMKARVEDRLSRALDTALCDQGEAQSADAGRALSESHAAIGRAAHDYNDRVRDYNAALDRMQQLARFLGYEPRETFSLENADGGRA